MAEKRMFAKTIIDSDAFLDMPLSSQSLYFHLSMRADDDGFINNPKKIQRMIGSSNDDLNILVAKRFVIPFESGVCVIKHWKIHNYIQNDRYKETMYKDEKSQLEVKSNKSYTLGTPTVEEPCIQDGYNMETQIRLDKTRLDKDRLGKDSIKKEKEVKKTNYDLLIDDYTTNKELKDTIYNFIKMRKTIRAALTDNALKLTLSKLDKMANDDTGKIAILEQSIMNSWKGIFDLKEGNNGNGVYGTKPNTGQAKKYNVKPPKTVELTDEERRRAEEELL